MIAAIEKATALTHHARELGAPLNEFVLLLTVPEGFELIDWLLSDEGPQGLSRAVLQFDADQAKVEGNPFLVLANFELMGLQIRRAGLH